MNQLPIAQQKRILRLMLNDDLIWEVAAKAIGASTTRDLVVSSAFRLRPLRKWNSGMDTPFGSSQLIAPRRLGKTEQGRAFAAQLRTRGQAKPNASFFRSDCFRPTWRDA